MLLEPCMLAVLPCSLMLLPQDCCFDCRRFVDAPSSSRRHVLSPECICDIPEVS
ncbi:hypothetical protein PISMIDRAFT_689119 [Pisolithus microcarpus 441]|uniref:Uncharacterized protein n=1 Tax=Pisolithus microcarpus 441 TaxID=765257 RepID=A0A0C9YG40_9AGAM|nr:hypothetical protein PISMIDRAFT_689119 [Pisolithus microcarpus 441]